MRNLRIKCIEVFQIQKSFEFLKVLNAMIFIIYKPLHTEIFKLSHEFLDQITCLVTYISYLPIFLTNKKV